MEPVVRGAHGVGGPGAGDVGDEGRGGGRGAEAEGPKDGTTPSGGGPGILVSEKNDNARKKTRL